MMSNGRYGVPNNMPAQCLFNFLFKQTLEISPVDVGGLVTGLIMPALGDMGGQAGDPTPVLADRASVTLESKRDTHVIEI